jgi:hypothetical protein
MNTVNCRNGRRHTMRTLACCLLWMIILPSILWADDFTGFRVPRHRVYNLRGYFDGTFDRNSTTNNGSGNQYGSINSAASNKNWVANGTLGLNGFWLYDSDPLRLKATFNSDLNGEAGALRSDNSYLQQQQLFRSTSRQTDESWSLTTRLRAYPNVIPEFPLGLISGVYASGDYGQAWSYRRDENSRTDEFSSRINDSRTADYYYQVRGDAGLGVGSVRDVTAVFDWYKAEKRLRERGVLIRPLSHAARQKLIDLTYIGDYYGSIHDRSGKFFWQEIENILLADSALGSRGLDAYDVWRMIEPYLDSNLPGRFDRSYPGVRERDRAGVQSDGVSYSVLRQRGWFVGFLVFGQHDHRIDRTFHRSRDYNIYQGEVQADTVIDQSSYRNIWGDALTYGPQAEFHLPWGPDWQFDGITTFRTNWIPDESRREWTTSLMATWLISDRWFAYGMLRHAWVVDGSWSGPYDRYSKSWSTDLAAQLNYYLEDRVSLYANLTYSQGRITSEQSNYQSYSNTYQWGSAYHMHVGLNYHFFGLLNAEGLVPSSIVPVAWN